MDRNLALVLAMVCIVWCFTIAMVVTTIIATRAPASLKHLAKIIRAFGLNKIVKVIGKVLRQQR